MPAFIRSKLPFFVWLLLQRLEWELNPGETFSCHLPQYCWQSCCLCGKLGMGSRSSGVIDIALPGRPGFQVTSPTLGLADHYYANSMEAPNLTLSNCNPLLPAVKSTLGQFPFLPPAPHFQLCLENTNKTHSEVQIPSLCLCQGKLMALAVGGPFSYGMCKLISKPTHIQSAPPMHSISSPLRLSKLMRVQ